MHGNDRGRKAWDLVLVERALALLKDFKEKVDTGTIDVDMSLRVAGVKIHLMTYLIKLKNIAQINHRNLQTVRYNVLHASTSDTHKCGKLGIIL